jgi:hypothetical protein
MPLRRRPAELAGLMVRQNLPGGGEVQVLAAAGVPAAPEPMMPLLRSVGGQPNIRAYDVDAELGDLTAAGAIRRQRRLASPPT